MTRALVLVLALSVFLGTAKAVPSSRNEDAVPANRNEDTRVAQSSDKPSRDEVLSTMKRATRFMVEKVAHRGGYVWTYLPDLSRRWGEMEARDTMIWIQPPGTPTMGHLYLDTYHATGDEYYYQAAEQVAGALIWGQHPAGGWNYLVDFAGDRSLREWYDTVGKNAWRLEEFQHYWGNATFDDAGTIDAAKFLLRLYIEKQDPKYRPALDKAIQFVLDSQYLVGAWPQRFPRGDGASVHGAADYTSYLTFNDDVAGENIDFLMMSYQALGDARLLDPINRAMNAFLVTQQGPPQPGWALQYTPDLKPAAARTYEPLALTTHTTAANVGLLIRFYRMTGDTKFLARIPEALDWLEALRLPPGIAPAGRTHPTFVEIGTNKPLYVHREGSNVVNGRYFVDDNPKNTIGHYSSFRPIDVAGLRKQYEEARALKPDEATKGSPLKAAAGPKALPRYVAVAVPRDAPPASTVVADLNKEGYWLAKLGTNSHPYRKDGSATRAAGDFSTTHVGDDTDTSPYPDNTIAGISLDAYIRNMSILIKTLDTAQASPASATVLTLDNLDRIGGHAVTRIGAPRVVATPLGPAVEFNGASDGLLLDTNLLQGLARFTIEVVFEPAVDGQLEQRFFHAQETASENHRALIELRLLPDATWYVDTFLRDGESQLALIDKSRTHAAGHWYAAALTYDGRTLTSYVDGVQQMTGAVAFTPLGEGKTSIGVRQNRVSWFKGRVRLVRITPDALPADRLLAKPTP
jgi:PelA/Pel-15E family pectate lyase